MSNEYVQKNFMLRVYNTIGCIMIEAIREFYEIASVAKFDKQAFERVIKANINGDIKILSLYDSELKKGEFNVSLTEMLKRLKFSAIAGDDLESFWDLDLAVPMAMATKLRLVDEKGFLNAAGELPTRVKKTRLFVDNYDLADALNFVLSLAYMEGIVIAIAASKAGENISALKVAEYCKERDLGSNILNLLEPSLAMFPNDLHVINRTFIVVLLNGKSDKTRNLLNDLVCCGVNAPVVSAALHFYDSLQRSKE